MFEFTKKTLYKSLRSRCPIDELIQVLIKYNAKFNESSSCHRPGWFWIFISLKCATFIQVSSRNYIFAVFA